MPDANPPAVPGAVPSAASSAVPSVVPPVGSSAVPGAVPSSASSAAHSAAHSAVPPAVAAARRLLGALARLGVRHVVVAPGSRSAPLAYAAVEADARGEMTLHVRVDERDAAFLALGLVRGDALAGAGTPAPAAVVTTSGTAVANLHPAVLEAHHAGVPLLLLTADRPHELHGTGANQTTDQVGMFGGAVRLALDVPAPDGRPGELADLDHLAARAVDAARGLRSAHPGPVHLDLAYREPLVPADGDVTFADGDVALAGGDALEPGSASSGWTSSPSPTVRSPSAASAVEEVAPPLVVARPSDSPLPAALTPALADVAETVVVAGDGAGRVARTLAESRGWPLLAEPSSGACGGPRLVAAHRTVLEVLGGRVRRVVVLGRTTLSRPVQRLLAGALAPAAPDGSAPSVEVVVVAPDGAPWPDAARHAAVVLPGVPAAWLEPRGELPVDAAVWRDTWRAASDAARAVVGRAVAPDAPGPDEPDAIDGLTVAAALAAASGPDDVLVVGSSSPVRDLDLVATWDEPPAVVANRGLAGIDGLVSTASGVALAVTSAPTGAPDAAAPAVRSTRRVRAYLGDLALLHDVGGLLRLRGERAADLQVVVANDGGGSIFATLEPGGLAALGPAQAATFERVFATPHDVDVAALCAAYGVRHVRVRTRAALDAALAEPPDGTVVIEAVVDRSRRRAAGERLARDVVRSVAAALDAATAAATDDGATGS